MEFILTLLLVAFGLVVPLSIAFFGVFAIWGDIKGAPFVPTSAKLLQQILEGADLKKGQQFLELGSGDGRITRLAVKEYGVKGEGVDIHPLLIWYANFLAKSQNLDAHFKRADLFKIDYKKAEVIFVFLLPKTVKRLVPKFLKECKKGTLVISHGFKIEGLEKQLYKTQKRDLFSTYFYRL